MIYNITYVVELALQRIEAQYTVALSRHLGTPNILSKGKLAPRTVLVPLRLYPATHPLHKESSSISLIQEVGDVKDGGAPKEAKAELTQPKGILKKTTSTTDAIGNAKENARPLGTFEWTKEGDRIRIDVYPPANVVRTCLLYTPLPLLVPPLFFFLFLVGGDCVFAFTLRQDAIHMMHPASLRSRTFTLAWTKHERWMTAFRAHCERLGQIDLLDSIPDVVRHDASPSLPCRLSNIEYQASKTEHSMFDAQRDVSMVVVYGLRTVGVYVYLRGTYAYAYSWYLE